MLILQWKPYAECFNAERDPPVLSACRSVLNQMPVSEIPQIFGAQGTESIDVPLPVKYSDCQSVASSSCYVSLLIDPSYSAVYLHSRNIDNRTAGKGQLVWHVDLCCVDSSNVCNISPSGRISW